MKNVMESNASSVSWFRRWLMIWEDQHPLARNTVLMMLLMLGLSIMLRIGIFLGPHYLNLTTLFRLTIIEDVWFVAHVLVLIMFIYSIARLLGLAIKRRASYLGVILTMLSMLILLIPFFTMPSIFEAATAHQLDHPYDQVLSQVKTLCQGWMEEHGTRSFDPDNYDLGLLEGRANVRRESSTVFFDFGDEDQVFGLACVLNGEEPPDGGYRTKNYVYNHINGDYYEYYDDPTP